MGEGVVCRRIAIRLYRQRQLSGPQRKLLPAVHSDQITQQPTDSLFQTKLPDHPPPPKKPQGNFVPISGSCREVYENCTLLGCYEACGGIFTDVSEQPTGTVLTVQGWILGP